MMRSKKKGRPPLAKARTKRINVSLHTDEFATVAKAAKRSGVSLSEFLRAAGLAAT